MEIYIAVLVGFALGCIGVRLMDYWCESAPSAPREGE